MLAVAIGAGRAEKALEKRISVSFASPPFVECLEELREKTGIAYAVDGRELDGDVLKRPVTLRLKNARARKATRMVSITVEEMIVPEREVTSALSKLGCSLLTRTAAQRLRKKATVTKAASLLCFNGQRTRSHGGSNRSILADFDVCGAAVDPVMMSMNTGVSLDVLPRVSVDGKAVLLDFRLESCGEPEIMTFEYLECHATPGSDGPALLPGSVETPRRELTLFRSSFKLPLGKTAVFFAGDGTKAFLVSAEIVRP